MQPPTPGQPARRRSMGRICRCCECGQVVWPYPLPLSPTMHLARGYPKSRAELDRGTWTLRFDPLLWCDSCAPPLVVKWWIRWERMAAELLETLPSIPADVEGLSGSDADAAELAAGEVPCTGADVKVAVCNRVALP